MSSDDDRRAVLDHRAPLATVNDLALRRVGLPKQPDVVVRVPSAIYIGERVVADVEVHVERAVTLDFIDVNIAGTSAGHAAAGRRAPALTVSEPRQARDGWRDARCRSRTLSGRVHASPGTAPSHEHSPGERALYLDVHASIPWWPDGKYSLHVARAPAASARDVERTPIVTREPFDAGPEQPRIEIALASTTLVAG